jgi:hypothetical protein
VPPLQGCGMRRTVIRLAHQQNPFVNFTRLIVTMVLVLWGVFFDSDHLDSFSL